MAGAFTGTTSADIDHASAILATEPASAEREARAYLERRPRDPRGLLVLASARRRQGDAAAALAILTPLAQAYPRAAHTRYELGKALAAQDRPDRATAELRQAVTLKPDLAEAWRALGDLLFAQGDNDAADAAFAAHDRAMVRDPELRPAADALHDGRFEEAEHRLRTLLTSRPGGAAAHRLLGRTLGQVGRHAEAEVVFARALRLEPNHEGAQFAHADAQFRQQKGARALTTLRSLLDKYPSEPPYLNLLAACLGLVGDHARVITINETLLARFPKQPKIWLNYGHALRIVGRRDDAIAAYRRCIALAPGLGDAYWSLANLKVAALTPDDEAAIRAQLAPDELASDDRLHLHYALGKALEDRDAVAEAFDHYSRGAALRRAAIPYDADQTTALKARSTALFTRAFFEAATGGCRAPDPIFILGLPRSGSTLVEQILSSHSAVEGTMELPDIGLIARGITGAAHDGPPSLYPDTVAGLRPDELTALGETFLRETQVHRPLGRPFFIDKMPNNFQHLGLIQLILPNAKIIDARRHPMGACFSAFKQHFAQGQNFSYDLTDLGRYYSDYVDLLHHFDDVLPGRIHRVIYEDLVDDPESEVRRLLDYCGLPFEVACLAFHENTRAVRTVSSEQVRRPIFRDGLHQWRRFEPWLEPLEAALGATLETWRGG